MVKKIIVLLLLIVAIQLNSQHFEILNQTENELIVKFILPEFDPDIVLIHVGENDIRNINVTDKNNTPTKSSKTKPSTEGSSASLRGWGQH